MARPRDTSQDAHRMQIEALRRLGPARRVEMALRMSDDARAVTMDGIRGRHPEYDEAMVRQAFFRALYGDAAYRKIWPRGPLLAP